MRQLELQAEAEIKSVGGSNKKVKEAHSIWELHRAILAEAEARVIERLVGFAGSGAGFPTDEFQKLKAARAECAKAFDRLLSVLDDVAG